jgi:uncharacterized protein (DUF2141 family)
MRVKVLYLFVVGLAISCAQIRSPQGGAKDEKPPVVISSPDGMTGYTEQELVILFDEYVDVYDVQNEVLISPPSQKPPKIEARLRKIVCNFSDTLAANTTRVINFGNAIRDVNEGNILANYTLAYSNGRLIDSLEFKGQIRDAARDSVVPGVRVMLFSGDTGITSKTELPRYVTRTDKDGRFNFRYLKEGSYYLTALEDKNQNFHWEEGEAVAMQFSFITLPDTNISQLLMSVPMPSAAMPNGFNADSSGSFSFQVDECFDDSLEIRCLDMILPKYRLSSKVYSWLPATVAESAPVEIFCREERVDSFQVTTYSVPSKFQLKVSGTSTIRSQDTIIVTSPRCLSNAGAVTMMRMKDSTMISGIDVRLRNPFQIAIKARWSPGDTYKLVLTGANDLLNGMADTLRTDILLSEKESTGEILVAHSTTKSVFWIESKGKKFLPDATSRAGTALFSELSPGDYILFELQDENNNGKFDPLVMKERPTERILRSQPINVRANWTAEISPPSTRK